MSWLPFADPILGDKRSCDSLELVVVPRVRDLGDGFEVRRALPSDKRQMVGPFIFFDQMGPAQFLAGLGLELVVVPECDIARAAVFLASEDSSSLMVASSSSMAASPNTDSKAGTTLPWAPGNSSDASPIGLAADPASQCYGGSRARGFGPYPRRWRKAPRVLPP
jgi:hypothetical protein